MVNDYNNIEQKVSKSWGETFVTLWRYRVNNRASSPLSPRDVACGVTGLAGSVSTAGLCTVFSGEDAGDNARLPSGIRQLRRQEDDAIRQHDSLRVSRASSPLDRLRIECTIVGYCVNNRYLSSVYSMLYICDRYNCGTGGPPCY